LNLTNLWAPWWLNYSQWKNLENIKSIYGTSMGAIIGTILVLNYDWETIDDYLIKRPWNNIYKFDLRKALVG
jgi:predicted acylesterase/phospholipase RssA